MSLDVYLTIKGVQNLDGGSHIFIREDGKTKEITREEWDKRYPDREPVTVELESDDDTVYSDNITHNLGGMANKAGVYYAMWRPEERKYKHAKQLIKPLERGLAKLRAEPDKYKKMNPDNGWGSYDGLVEFVEKYLQACREYPDAEVYASR